VVPHFEKMLYDNAELLRNYVHGFQSYVREEFLQTAREIVAWLDSTMTDRERGGFYASQDADINLDDDGDYFTWTLDEATLRTHRDSARGKLLDARNARRTPFIDRTLYTGWNAMAVTAYLETARVLRMDSAQEFALLTLDRLLNEAWDGAETLSHVIAYGAESAGMEPAEKVPGTLDDYAFTVHACVDGWIATGNISFYRAAVKLADAMIDLFYDPTANAFYDAAAPKQGTVALGALGARRKPLQDSPTPAGNPTAASALLRLEVLSGRQEYRDIAEDTLASFAGIVEHFGLYAGSYGLALERLLLPPVLVVVVGSGPEAARLEAIAMARFRVNKSVLRVDPERFVAGGLPEALSEMLLNVPPPPGARVWARVCLRHTCFPPITDAEELLQTLERAL
jgi:uncharacterized protein YyaL (SSP411 family)